MATTEDTRVVTVSGCTRCTKPFTTDGPHCITVLRCGHLIGYSCAMAHISGYRECPSCCASAAPGDIRHVYTTLPITVLDQTSAVRARLLADAKMAAEPDPPQKIPTDRPEDEELDSTAYIYEHAPWSDGLPVLWSTPHMVPTTGVVAVDRVIAKRNNRFGEAVALVNCIAESLDRIFDSIEHMDTSVDGAIHESLSADERAAVARQADVNRAKVVERVRPALDQLSLVVVNATKVLDGKLRGIYPDPYPYRNL